MSPPQVRPSVNPRSVRADLGRGHGVLYDGSLFEAAPEAGFFTAEHWQRRGRVEGLAGGRGSTLLLRWAERELVLKHYCRGGLVARLTVDRYIWLGAERTRAFREWRILNALSRHGLPVPRPIAAHYQRIGPSYRADLITERIPAAEPLSRILCSAPLSAGRWRNVGALIRRFHAAGVWHADLNAHNILLTDEAEYLIDFDRGRLRRPGRWQATNLARLQRSLAKISAADARIVVRDADWEALLAGYRGA